MIKPHSCNRCKADIKFSNRKPFNMDGTPHRCMAGSATREPPKATDNQQAVLFAMAAMNAIISGQIQAGGVDHVHRMNFHDVADAAWQAAAAMISAEKNYREDFGGDQ